MIETVSWRFENSLDLEGIFKLASAAGRIRLNPKSSYLGVISKVQAEAR